MVAGVVAVRDSDTGTPTSPELSETVNACAAEPATKLVAPTAGLKATVVVNADNTEKEAAV
ncbi:MAG: hypothetical protein JRM80_06300 [Nitrososphaerota archaeon]|nr:hypothetical protein [Nitrososphaerota archaeon]